MLDIMRQNAQSWGIKILFGIIILAFIFTFGSPQSNNDTVIAYVNGDPIAVDDFQRQLPRTANQEPDAKRSVLFQMVNALLMEQVAQKSGITVSDAELVRAINANPQFRTNGSFDMDRYTASVGGKPERFEERERLNLLIGKFTRFAALPAQPGESEIRSLFLWQNEQAVVEYTVIKPGDFYALTVSHDDEAKEYYEKNKALFTEPAKANFEYVAFTPAALAPGQEVSDQEIQDYFNAAGATLVTQKRFQFRHILLPVGETPTQEDVGVIQKKMGEIQKRLAQGEDFASLAKRFALPGDIAPGEPIWMAPAEMPEELAQALSGLDNNAVSRPIITQAGLNIVQLVDTETPRPMTLEEAKPVIVERLAQEKASKILGDKLDETISQMNQGVKLPQIAENLELAVKETGPMTRQQLVEEFGLNAEAADTLMTLMDGNTTMTPLKIGNGGYLVASKIDDLPETVMPLEQVRQQIDVDIRRSKAQELALEKAQEILVQSTKGEGDALAKYAARLHDSEPFVRSGQIPGLQVDPKLSSDAFSVQTGQWLPTPYSSAFGYVVARLKETLPASEELWQQQKQGWAQAAMEIYRRELYQAMTNSLFERANTQGGIELVRSDLLN
ncbi:MAG: SurA N-terminal domain-containing protein [Desulfovibrio sp.]